MAKTTKTVAAAVLTSGKGKGKGKGKPEAAPAVAPKGKGGKPASVKAKEATRQKKPTPPTTFKLDGVKGGTAGSADGADGVTRTRAGWNGHSLSGLLKWVGKNGGTIDNARSLVASLGLADVTSPSTVSCQFYAGYQLSLGKNGNPKHGGKAADLDKSEVVAVKRLAGM
jgi:hypothetical protein